MIRLRLPVLLLYLMQLSAALVEDQELDENLCEVGSIFSNLVQDNYKKSMFFPIIRFCILLLIKQLRLL